MGTFGNTLIFLILMRRCMRRISSYNYLAVLSITDTFVLYVGLLRIWIGELTGFDAQNQANWMCKLISVVGYTVSDYSVWLIIAVTVERYIAVVWPFKANSMCNRRRAFMVIIGILCILLLINAHFFWTTAINKYPVYNETILRCDGAPGYERLVTDIWSWVDAFIYSFVPFVVILLLNALIIHRVLLAGQARSVMSGNQSGGGKRHALDGGKKLTIMLLTISFSFLLTTLPMNITLIVTAFLYPQAKNDLHLASKLKLLRTVTELLMYTNHSMNFFLYCATGKKFRQQLCLLLCHPKIVGTRAFNHWLSEHSHAISATYKDTHSSKYNPGSTSHHNQAILLQKHGKLSPNLGQSGSIRSVHYRPVRTDVDLSPRPVTGSHILTTSGSINHCDNGGLRNCHEMLPRNCVHEKDSIGSQDL